MSREMKYSGIPWIGDIPKEWRTATLLQVLRSRISDGPHETPNLVDDGIPFISVDSLNESEDIDLKIVKKFISEEDYIEYSKKTQLEIGDILFTKSATIGKTAIVKNDRFMIWSPIAVLKPNNLILNKFLYHLVSNGNFKDYVCQLSTFNTQFNIGMRTLEKAKISLPSYSEQQRIASFLDKKCAEVDEMIALQEKIIEELKAYKQSVTTEAVTKGLNPNVPMKESDIEWIGQIPAHWEVHPFKAYYKTTKGLNITKENLVEDGVPVISYGQIHSKLNTGTSINNELIRFVPEEYLTSNPECLSLKYDMFFADTSEDREGAGNIAFIDTDIPIFAGYHTIIARPCDLVRTKYFAYLTKTDAWRTQIRSNVTGVKVFSISQKLINRVYIIIPPNSEQQSIADYLDTKCTEIDNLISIKQQKIENLKEYKKSIIYEYVTGKKEVED